MESILVFKINTFRGRRPNGIYIPRYHNIDKKDDRFLRGFGFQGGGKRPGWRERKSYKDWALI